MEPVSDVLKSVLANARGDRRTHMPTVKGVSLETNKTVWYSVPGEVTDLGWGPDNLIHRRIDRALTDPVVSHDQMLKSTIT